MTKTLDAWLPGAYQLDPAALTEIYQTLSPPLYRYAYRLLGNARDAEDSVAETFHRLLLALQHGNGPREHLSAYLYRIAHNLITDRYRRGPQPEAELDETLEAADDDPAEAAAQRIAQARARAALWKLTTDQRQVILLKYFEGLSNEEVAAALDKPVGAIKSLQHRALDSMRRVLAAEQIGELI
jgi:RNA polymerase sigma-70 factor (ECF subfamily)